MITVTESDLVRRRQAVQAMFKPLCRVKHPVVNLQPQQAGTNLVLGDKGAGSLRQLRYPSRVDGVYLNYFEVWLTSDDQFVLEKAYFHVDQITTDGASADELLALHCDPMIDEKEESYLYKSAPHMHFSTLPKELSKAHIAMCLDSRERVLSGIGSFRDSMGRIMHMINTEFLARM